MGNDPRRGQTRPSLPSLELPVCGERETWKKIVNNVNGVRSSPWRWPASDAFGPTPGLAVNTSGFAGLNVTHTTSSVTPLGKGQITFFFFFTSYIEKCEVHSKSGVCSKSRHWARCDPGPQPASPRPAQMVIPTGCPSRLCYT